MSEKEAFTIEKIQEAANAGIAFFQWMLGTFYRDGKGGLAHVVGNENAVHDAVGRGEEHHADGRQCKAQQFSVSKML